jgi:superfamily II DNA or RNA helicase
MDSRRWCDLAAAWVRVLEERRLFGQDVATVAVEGTWEVLTVPGASLREDRPLDLPALRSLAAAARLQSALGHDLLLAPLTSNVLSLPHQFRVLQRAVSRWPVRLLLADEVGLGKTIEAGLILKELKLRGEVERVLVLAPKSVLLQWVAEMDERFGERFVLVEPGSWSAGGLAEGANRWTEHAQVITSYDAVKPRGNGDGRRAQQNRERFADLVCAGWDLVIIDESHKVAGASPDVARHELARAIAEAAPHLLLLSATPHSGKSDAFSRLLSLLDAETFNEGTLLSLEKVTPWVVRTDKRTVVDSDGRPLFTPRVTELVRVPFTARHHLQQELYEQVSEYVLEGYRRAAEGRDTGAQLLLLLIQRLMSSSTRAVRRFLERRREALLAPSVAPAEDGRQQATIEALLGEAEEEVEESAAALAQTASLPGEAQDVQRLVALAARCEATGPDARAEELYRRMVALAREESDPALKCLIFTEFTATQEMLREYLEQRGYAVAILHGQLSLSERRAAQEEFRERAQVLVSTDAGGEGINLQFAHVVFNYDLPWNPMRVEQRIGRVDRIGQRHAVRAYNLVLENSVEARIYEVLLEKLSTILAELGVDKTGDVLDSREAGMRFESLARVALVDPEAFDSEVERVVLAIRRSAEETQRTRALIGVAPDGASRVAALPWQGWAQVMLADAEPVPTGGDQMVALPPTVIERLSHLPAYFAPCHAAPVLRLSGLGFALQGWFALWRVGVTGLTQGEQRLLALCVSEAGEVYGASAQRVWDALASPQARVEADGETREYDYPTLETLAQEQAELLFRELLVDAQEQAVLCRTTVERTYLGRRRVLAGLPPALRETRGAELEEEYCQRLGELDESHQVLPDLRCLLLAKVLVT